MYQCWESGTERLCAEADEQFRKIDTGKCAEDQMCYINHKLDGVCIKSPRYRDPKRLFPGQTCKVASMTDICGFGPKTCGEDARCEGYSVNESCLRTADCNYGLYCNNGFCTPLLMIVGTWLVPV